ncbi:multidrug effflux MFS transporter [Deinococcus sonorensis]|uniref:Multidrug effflux MFS transporter n=2 Tax=Deinococcus sonorensis TaxID=309891 RepID=A0AAU7U747_9DEIO
MSVARPQAPSRAPTLAFTLVLGTIMAIGPLTIDLYLPAFPQIVQDLMATPGQVQYTLAVYLFGLALGQALYGPVADKYGRRAPLLAGLALYVAGAALCALAPSIGVLIAGRLVQALGGAAGAVIVSAVVRDRYEGKAAASLFSTLMLVTGVAPAIAPTLGTWLLTFLHWRALFGVLAAYGALCLLLSAQRLPETHAVAARAGMRLRDTAVVYAGLVRQRRFMGYSLAGGFSFGALFAYITGSPFLFLQELHVRPGVYALLFGVNAAGLTLASQVNRALLRRYEPEQMARVAGRVALLVGLLLLAAALLQLLSVPLVAALFFALLCCAGMLFPNNSALALSSVSERVGSASALNGTLQSALGALSGTLVGALGGGSVAIMTVITVCALGVLICHQVARR